VYDFDDAIFQLHTTETNRRFGWLKFPGKTAAICRLSRSVVVANRFLADYAKAFNDDVHVVPSSVDTERFRPMIRTDNPIPVVGWSGSATSMGYLEAFAPSLRELLQRERLVLRVHSDRRPSLGAIPFEWAPWSPTTEPEELNRFDIGIMPMPDDLWSRGKSAMKALLYMAVGVPCIASPVGMSRELIVHGENGLLATTTAEWADALRALVQNRDLRTRIGAAGRRTVEARYSAESSARLFAEVLRSAAG
jgi:glycosyltransferase involved in cell wall biosynthesis